jgi:hypothetical protein
MDPAIFKILFGAALKGLGAAASKLWKLFAWRTRRPRGGQERRHASRDRRVGGLEQRLRYGIWLEFHKRTDLGRRQVLTLSDQRRSQLYEAAIAEAQLYEFSDRGTGMILPPSAAVQAVLELACRDWSLFPRRQQRASALTVALGNRLTSCFNVRMQDRRLQQRRATA